MYPTITMPTLEEVVPGVNPLAPTDQQDRYYNNHCTRLVRDALAVSPIIRTHYPYDRPDGSTDDTVTLDAEGNITIVDEGAPL